VVETPKYADYSEPIFAKGTSRRIYGELYKVIDSSDVILHILDARDPLGTLCQSVLDYIKKEKAHKQVVLIINKCDLVPNWVTVCVSFSSVTFIRNHLDYRHAISSTSHLATLQSHSTRHPTTPLARVLSFNYFGNSRSFTLTKNKYPLAL
jgi:ribosome biogenesis GTPase A